MSTRQSPTIVSIPAGSDLSTKKNYLMKLSSGKLATATAGSPIIGILTDDPGADGEPGATQIAGIGYGIAGGTCTQDGPAASDSAGKLVDATGSARAIGVFMDTGGAGDLVRVVMGAIATAQAADIEAVTSGAMNPDVAVSNWSVTSTVAGTLAAPTRAGQRKTVRCVLAATTPLGTLTVSSPDDTAGFVCASTFVFNAVGQELTFEATTALKWRCVAKKRAGVLATITAGTDVLTGKSMNAVYSLAVDGTDAGTGTGGLPNGSVVGERCSIVCELAANTPIGSLSGTYKGVFGTAYTAFGAIGVVGSATVIGDYGQFIWDGAAWQVEAFAGCTFS